MESDPIQVVILAPTRAARVGLRAMVSLTDGLVVIWEGIAAAEGEIEDDEVDVVIYQGEQPRDDEPPFSVGESAPAVVWVTAEPQAAALIREYALPAWGVVSPEADAEELIAAVIAVHYGFIVAPPERLTPLWVAQPAAGSVEMVETLTPRETEVLQLLAQGLANKQIALELEISEHTVKFHISSIYSKLGTTNRTEAVRVGLQQGIILL